jgi:hypothetical protein
MCGIVILDLLPTNVGFYSNLTIHNNTGNGIINCTYTNTNGNDTNNTRITIVIVILMAM